jgi:hypothetical protein
VLVGLADQDLTENIRVQMGLILPLVQLLQRAVAVAEVRQMLVQVALH